MQQNIIDNKDLLMISLSKYYSNKNNINTIIPIIRGNSNISLRLLDWFVTNYSKKYGIVITHIHENNVIHFNVYLSYRSQLKAYSKQQFDPFKRRERIKFFYDKSDHIESTIGQLNFFRWILQNNILEYIQNNIKNIENDMISSQKENANKKKDNKESIVQKRQELSKSCVKNMNTYSGIRTIKFD
jgi:hypothetical protein